MAISYDITSSQSVGGSVRTPVVVPVTVGVNASSYHGILAISIPPFIYKTATGLSTITF